MDFFCDSAGIRTQGPYIKSVLLYQLSYGIADLRVQIYRIFSFYNCYLGKFGCFKPNFVEMPQKSLCLIGFMGSGKTAVGEQLSKALGWSWVDTDLLIEEQTGKSIATIVYDHGWPTFRAIESEVLKAIDCSTPLIISSGGGLPMIAENWDWIAKHCIIVYLETPADVLAERLRLNKQIRPSIAGMNTVQLSEFVIEELQKRIQVYSKADIVVDGNQAINHVVDAILDSIKVFSITKLK